MKTKIKLANILFPLTLAVLAGCGSEAAQEYPPPPEVGVARVEASQVRGWEEFTGRVEAAETVALRPRVAGYIDSVNYVEGGEVAAGDVMFVIDQRPYRAALEQAQAELARTQSQLELARTEAERAERLVQTRVISAEEVDQRRANAATAAANVRAARAAVDFASLELEFTEVRAPLSGRAGRALVTAGNLVSAESALTTIVSLDPVHVYFESDERTYLTHQATMTNGGGNTVQVGLTGNDGYTYQGVLDFVDNQVDRNTGTIRARAVLSNSSGVLTPGLFARVRLLGAEEAAMVLIDDKAILTDQDRKFVWVVEDGHALRRDVQLGRLMDGRRVVQSGLEPGEHIIINGVQKVFFSGMPVVAQ